MHWQITTATMDAKNPDEPFRITACMRTGNATNEPKKVTCPECKRLLSQPRSPLQAANLHLVQLNHLAQNEEAYVSLVCNECPYEKVVQSELVGLPENEQIQALLDLLAHCAYDHTSGTEAIVRVEWSVLSVYQLRLSMGATPATDHEQNWRESLDAPEKV
jgi:hypothetical protein